MSRPTWNQYFAELATLTAARSTCPRASVGCVLVKDNRVVATGYNGSAPGMPHCTDVGCFTEGKHCIRTIHAEVNAIAQAARTGVTTEGATAYVTHTPCLSCGKALAAAGISTVHVRTQYGKHAKLLESLYGLEIVYE